MPTIVRSLPFLAVLCVAGVLQAAEGPDAAARAKAIAPFVDEQTIVVGHVDLARIEIDGLLGKFAEIVPDPEDDLTVARAEARRAQAEALQAGARELYVVYSLADMPQRPPFVIIPHAEAVDAGALVASLLSPPHKHLVIERVRGALFFGDRRTLERVKTIAPDARGALARAFEAAGDSAVQIVVIPPEHAGRVIEEMIPELPPEVGGGPSTILTRGLLWAAAGVEGPPNMSLRLVIQSRDKQAATALRSKWLEVVRLLFLQEEVRRRLPDLEEAAALLTPRVQGDRLMLGLDEEGAGAGIRALLAVIRPPLEKVRSRVHREQSKDFLKLLGLAMHNYHDKHKSFPGVASFDGQGKPLLSWRVRILPYIDAQNLYDQFHLDEPWDSEHNRTLIEKMPETYRCPASKHRQKQGLSTYRVVSGEGTVFPGREAIPIKEIRDGTSNTIMIVEVDDDHAVIWTKPEGLPFDPENPARGLGGQFQDGFHAALCDGSALFFKLPADDEMLRRFLLRADGETVSRWW